MSNQINDRGDLLLQICFFANPLHSISTMLSPTNIQNVFININKISCVPLFDHWIVFIFMQVSNKLYILSKHKILQTLQIQNF